jgi:hypothetical protein
MIRRTVAPLRFPLCSPATRAVTNLNAGREYSRRVAERECVCVFGEPSLQSRLRCARGVSLQRPRPAPGQPPKSPHPCRQIRWKDLERVVATSAVDDPASPRQIRCGGASGSKAENSAGICSIFGAVNRSTAEARHISYEIQRRRHRQETEGSYSSPGPAEQQSLARQGTGIERPLAAQRSVETPVRPAGKANARRDR